jgi:predicted Zn-dependent protease
MKTQKLFLFSLLILTILSSCKKDNLPQEATTSITQQEIDNLKSFISKTTGTDVSQISYDETGKEFRISHDLRMKLEDAQTRYNKSNSGAPQTEQRRGTYLLQDNIARYLDIYFMTNNNVPADWVNAVVSAVNNWNNAPTATKLNLNINPLNQIIFPLYGKICIQMYTENGSSTIAYTYLPASDGTPPNAIYINTYYNSLSQSEKVFTMTHELGHAIGLHHTNQTAGTLIPGTPASDPNSVMNSVVLPWSAFTTGDLTALSTLYPN